ncbi:MAG: hypothetical protein IH946_09850, partial [Bacteroidetes bacterium]|nr:hypothetical protein [Bacteroidota bacterium]
KNYLFRENEIVSTEDQKVVLINGKSVTIKEPKPPFTLRSIYNFFQL